MNFNSNLDSIKKEINDNTIINYETQQKIDENNLKNQEIQTIKDKEIYDSLSYGDKFQNSMQRNNLEFQIGGNYLDIITGKQFDETYDYEKKINDLAYFASDGSLTEEDTYEIADIARNKEELINMATKRVNVKNATRVIDENYGASELSSDMLSYLISPTNVFGLSKIYSATKGMNAVARYTTAGVGEGGYEFATGQNIYSDKTNMDYLLAGAGGMLFQGIGEGVGKFIKHRNQSIQDIIDNQNSRDTDLDELVNTPAPTNTIQHNSGTFNLDGEQTYNSYMPKIFGVFNGRFDYFGQVMKTKETKEGKNLVGFLLKDNNPNQKSLISQEEKINNKESKHQSNFLRNSEEFEYNFKPIYKKEADRLGIELKGEEGLQAFIIKISNDLEHGKINIDDLHPTLKKYLNDTNTGINKATVENYKLAGEEANLIDYHYRRDWNAEKLYDSTQRLGYDNTIKIIADSMKNVAKAEKYAKMIVDTNLELRTQIQSGMAKLSDQLSVDKKIDELMKEYAKNNNININDFAELSQVDNILKQKQKKKQKPKPIRSRLPIDITNKVDIEGKTYSVSDFIVNDNYYMSKLRSLRKSVYFETFKNNKPSINGKEYDLTNKNDINNLLNYLSAKGENVDKIGNVIEDLERGYLKNDNGRINDLVSIIGNIQTYNLMGNTWMYQTGELMTSAVSTGINSFIKAFPEANKLIDAVEKNIATPEQKEIMSFFNDSYHVLTEGRYQNTLGQIIGDSNVDDIISRNTTDKFVKNAKNISSKMANFTVNKFYEKAGLDFLSIRKNSSYLRLNVGLAKLLELKKLADKGIEHNNTLWSKTANRLNDLGIGKEDWQIIAPLLKNAEKQGKGDLYDIIKVIDEKMPEKKEMLLNAIQKHASRFIIDSSLGGSIQGVENKVLGKLLSKFLTYSLKAYHTLLLNGVKNADAQTISQISAGLGAMTLVYYGRNYALYSQDKEKLKQRLEPKEVVAGVVGTSPQLGLLAMPVNSLLQYTGVLNGYGRASGLPSDIIKGNVFFNSADNIAKNIKNMYNISTDENRNFTVQDLKNINRTIAPNFLPITAGFNILEKEVGKHGSWYEPFTE